jgi:putative transposase
MKQILLSESYVGYKKRAHSVGVSFWHMEWCTKYRYKMMRKHENEKLMEACVRRKAFEHGIKILNISVEKEHVHTVVELKLNMTPSWALQILKGGSSYLFFRKKPNCRLRYPKGHFWSPGKFASSVGFIELDAARTYVMNQKKHYV